MSDEYYDQQAPDYYSTLEGLSSIMPLLDASMFARPAVTESGTYQDPNTPFYHLTRHFENLLGPEWQQILGMSQEMAPPPTQPVNDLYEIYGGDELTRSAMDRISNGESPNTIINELMETYEGYVNAGDQASRDAMVASVGRSTDSVTGVSGEPDWASFRNLLNSFATNEAALQRDYSEALAEYEAQPQYGFERSVIYDPAQAAEQAMPMVANAMRSAQAADTQEAYSNYMKYLDELEGNFEREEPGTLEQVGQGILGFIESAVNAGRGRGWQPNEPKSPRAASAREELASAPTSYKEFIEQRPDLNWRARGIARANQPNEADIRRMIGVEQRRQGADQPVYGRAQPRRDTARELQNAATLIQFLQGSNPNMGR